MKSCVRRGCAVVLLVIGLSLGGCAQSDLPASDGEPAQLKEITGTDLHRVILTERATQNLGIRTERVREVSSSAPGTPTRSRATYTTPTPAPRAGTFIPMTAVVYDPQGLSWTYTTPAPRTFLRVPIVIDHIVSGEAFLRSGPPVGTAVVTVGASELLGTEYGVGGE